MVGFPFGGDDSKTERAAEEAPAGGGQEAQAVLA
jgi:hypothetical protein